MKNAFKKLSRLGLVWQITIVFSIIIMIPTLIMTTAYIRMFQESLLKEAWKKLQEDLYKMAQNMDANLDATNSMMNSMVFSQDFPYFLDGTNTFSDREIQHYITSVSDELIKIKYAYQNKYDHIAIYSSSKQVGENFDWAYYLDSLYEKTYYNEIENNNYENFYGNVRYQDFIYKVSKKFDNLVERDKLILPIYRRIFNLSTREMVGLLEVNMTLTRLVDEASLNSQALGINYLLFDKNNTLVYKLSQTQNSDFSKLILTNDSGNIETTVDGVQYLVAYEKCSKTGIIRAVTMEKKAILESSSNINAIMIFIAIASFFVIIIFTNLTARIMLRRLRDMDKMIIEIEEGNFDVSINDEGVNEISRIVGSFNRMATRLNSVMKSMIEKEKAQQEAEFRALQAQINPHFLYNTLENIRMQCEVDEYYKVADCMTALGNLFKYSIKWDSYTVPFESEWKSLEDYIEIIKMRFEKNLIYKYSYDEKVGSVMVPKFILQPIVENCFSHAFKNSLPPWEVSINAFISSNRLIIQINDNGAGISSEKLLQIRQSLKNKKQLNNNETSKSSIGIINVESRINMLCPLGSGLEIKSDSAIGTTIIITIVL